jgi:hypothetical protein
MPDISSLSDIQMETLVLIVALALLLALIAAMRRRPSARTYFHALEHPPRFKDERPPPPIADTSDAALQLNAVMAGAYQKRRILNRSEHRVFRVIDEEIAAARKGFRLFAQTCLGEILTSPDEAAFRAINAKRVDMLIVDQGGWPALAVEYQGPDHYQGNAAARDAIKREALRRAGIRTIEITETDSDQQIRARVREYLGWAPLAAAQTPRPAITLAAAR